MKIAFFTYPSAFQNVGGGEVVLLKLREYLSKKSVQIDLFDPWKSRVEDYDVIHVFGSVKDCLGLIRVADTKHVPVVTSPVLWSDPSMGFSFFVRHAIKFLFPAFPSERREILMRSSLLFPNSEMEKKHIHRYFAVPLEKMKVIYNGVDKSFADTNPSLFRSKYGTYPFVLSVGRIEPRKNQLNLIRAMKSLKNTRLVLIGDPVSDYQAYYQSCRQEGEGFTEFIPAIAHGDPLLKSAYTACSLFALQGWFETPGLVALEAGLAGANLAVTAGGSTKEYFGTKVEYLEPRNPGQMSQVILKNLNKPKDTALQKYIMENFTWDKIADHYIAAYQGAAKS